MTGEKVDAENGNNTYPFGSLRKPTQTVDADGGSHR
jgi:hypothetical protein